MPSGRRTHRQIMLLKAPRLLLAAFLAFSLLAASAPAQTLTAIEVPPDGEYYLVVVNGVPSIRPMKLIKVGSAPQPPGNPDAPSPFELEVKRRAQTVLDNGGTKTTAVGIASVYSLVADGVDSGAIKMDQWEGLLKAATDTVLNNRPEDAAKWVKFTTDMRLAVEQFKGEGRLDTAQRVAVMLDSAATGTPATVSRLKDTDGKADGILDGIDLAQLIELIKLIMELLKLFSGDG
jgi:hypothetical protein